MRSRERQVRAMTAAITTNELDRLSRRIVAKPARLMVTSSYIGCVVLDVISQISPTAPLGLFACAIRPFGAIASPLFSDELLRYTVTGCSGETSAAAISIIFLLVKFSLGIVAAVIACCSVIIRPEGLAALCNALSDYALDKELYYKERRRWAKRIFILMGVDALAVLLTSRAAVSGFRVSLMHKLAVEDGTAILLPATIFMVLIFLVMFSAVRPNSSNMH